MKKKELKNLKLLTATAKMMQMAEKDRLQNRNRGYYRQGYEYGMYMRAKVTGDIFQVAFFLPEHLKAGGRSPAYVLYIDRKHSEFITYNRISEKWQTAKLDMLEWPDYIYYSEARWISENDNRLIRTCLQSQRGGYRGLLEYQQKVRRKQLKQRHKKETDPWDLDMEQVRCLPKDWERWVGKTGIDEHFIFYRYTRKGATTGYCTRCEKEVSIQKPRHNRKGVCPRCHKNITFKAEGKAGTVATCRHGMFLLQRCEDGMVIRAFEGYRKYERQNYRNPVQSCYEKKRTICSKTGVPLRAYYWGSYKNDETRWIASDAFRYRGFWYTSYYFDPDVPAGKIYPQTLPTLAKNELCRTGLEEWIKYMGKVHPEGYLKMWKYRPGIEQLVKAGLFSLVKDCFINENNYNKIMELPAGELAKRLGIDGQRLKRLRENQGDTAYLKWLRYEKKAGIILPEHVIRWFCQEKISGEDVEFISDRMSMVQIYHYVHRQMEENQRKSKDILSTWSDYLNMARRLNMDTGDAIIYRVSRLYQRHKELVERCQQMELSLQAAEILREYPHIEEIYRFIRGIYHYEDKKYMVLVPEKVEEIMTEGNTLHHCVNKTEKYWERIERQESYIFFLRKTEAPDKAYYTLEVEPDGTVRQKRTMYDRQEADIEDATKFLKKWQKEISKRITDRERALAKTSRMLRKEEFAELKKQQTIIYTGHLGGQLLVDILMRDLIENEDTFAAEAEEKAVAEAA